MLLQTLEGLRCELILVHPSIASAEFAAKERFSLILLDSTVSTEQRREIVAGLAGTTASVYYTFPVEYGCWWLPALLNGQDCHGSPAFRRSEFLGELARILCAQTNVAA
jgi:hypothetical protein